MHCIPWINQVLPTHFCQRKQERTKYKIKIRAKMYALTYLLWNIPILEQLQIVSMKHFFKKEWLRNSFQPNLNVFLFAPNHKSRYSSAWFCQKSYLNIGYFYYYFNKNVGHTILDVSYGHLHMVLHQVKSKKNIIIVKKLYYWKLYPIWNEKVLDYRLKFSLHVKKVLQSFFLVIR